MKMKLGGLGELRLWLVLDGGWLVTVEGVLLLNLWRR